MADYAGFMARRGRDEITVVIFLFYYSSMIIIIISILMIILQINHSQTNH